LEDQLTDRRWNDSN